MSATLLLALIIATPIVLALLLKVNAAVLFMSLCVGDVLVRYTSSDVASFLLVKEPRAGAFSLSTIELGLLLLPAILTMIFMVHSIKGHRLVLNLLPAIGAGLLTAILVEPLLSFSEQSSISHTALWSSALKAQTLIVLFGSFVSLLFLWTQRHHKKLKEHHSSKHRSKI